MNASDKHVEAQVGSAIRTTLVLHQQYSTRPSQSTESHQCELRNRSKRLLLPGRATALRCMELIPDAELDSSRISRTGHGKGPGPAAR